MDDQNIHRQLKRQINKYLSKELIADNDALSKFIDVVNFCYLSYERDAELFEQSSHLNDIGYLKINLKLKEELAKKENVQSKLVYAIQQLNDSEVKLENEDNLIDLLNILNKEIDFKKKFQDKLFVAKLNAEQANEAKSEFLSNMSHEIRTPLNAIIGLIYIMEKENSLSSFQENIEVLKYSAQNLHLLINDILDFSKIEAGKIENQITCTCIRTLNKYSIKIVKDMRFFTKAKNKRRLSSVKREVESSRANTTLDRQRYDA
jgi:signal transduction histidine kinase